MSGYQSAVSQATVEANDATLTTITTINPTAAAMSDFGSSGYYAGQTVQQIPNDSLFYRDPTPGPSSSISIQDANILKIQVVYCYQMFVPFANMVISTSLAALQQLTSSGTVPSCPQTQGVGGYRTPVSAQAIARMQVPYRGASYIDPAASAPASGGSPRSP